MQHNKIQEKQRRARDGSLEGEDNRPINKGALKNKNVDAGNNSDAKKTLDKKSKFVSKKFSTLSSHR